MIPDWQKANWPVVRIRDIGRLHGGGTPSRTRPEFFKRTIPWITGQDIPETHVAAVASARDYVTEEAIKESATDLIPAGTVLVTMRVTVGKTAVAAVPLCFSQDVTALLIHSPAIALPEYVAHFLRSRRESLLQKNQGSTIAGITRDSLELEHIPLPPLSEQHRIVEILQEAEEIRRLRAQAEAKTADLIPAIFEGTFGDPIGNPKRWPVHEVADLIQGTPKNGLYKPADRYGDGTPIIRIGDFGNGYSLDVRQLQRVRLSDDEIEQFGASNGQILINRVNSIEHLGKSVLVSGITEPTVYESNMMRLTLNSERVEPDFLIACLQHSSVLSKLRAKAKKAINQASINQTDVLTLQLAVPPIKLQQTFTKHVGEIHDLGAADAESRRLGDVCTASLSAHAFSGQLTAEWREKHQAKLATEARKRDEELTLLGQKPVLVNFSMADSAADAEAFNIPRDLNREQTRLLFDIKAMEAKKKEGQPA